MAKNSNPLASRFERSLGVVKYRLIGRSSGEVGTGKTHFWLGAPGPIVVMSFDQGLEGVALEEFGKKEIYPIEYDWTPTDTLSQDEAKSLRDKWIEDFEHACKFARTVIIDKEDDLWELFRYAEFGEPNDAPRNYPKLNQLYRKYINLPKSTEINFGLIQGMKDEWKTVSKKKSSGEVVSAGAATGNRVAKGFGDLDGLVHINLHHRREGGAFHIDVGKARGPAAMDVQDQSYSNVTFSEFAQLVFPDSTEDDWS